MSNDLTVIDTATLSAVTVFAPGGVDDVLSKLKAEVRSVKTDISTEKGRKEIASLAYKVARSKTALDELGKGLTADLKAQTGAIDAERKRIRDELDALKDEVRKPLDDFENAEKARITGHEDAISAISQSAYYGRAGTSDELRLELTRLENYPARDWQEFKARAEATLATEIDRTKALLADTINRENEAAELARLRHEASEREQRERDEAIAAQARKDAEDEARRREEETARAAEQERLRLAQLAEDKERIATAELARVEREKSEALERAAQAERDRIEADALAEVNRVEAEIKAERDRIAAEEDAKRREEEAAERERQKIVAQQKAEADAAAARESDRENRAKVNREAMAGLVAAGLTDEAAKAAVVAIAKGAVPHIKIIY